MGQSLASVVFQPQPPSYTGQAWLIDGKCIELHWLPTSRDPMPAYFFQPPGGNAHFTVLFSHGNAEDLGSIRLNFYEMAQILQCNFFLYEYAGYGIRGGNPSEAAVYEDVEIAFKYVRDTLEVPWQQIVAYGRSIGTAPTMHLATKAAMRGVIFQSPMSSIYRIPFRLRYSLPGDRFCNIDKAKHVRCPALIIHGTRDEIVPCWHGHALYEEFRRNNVTCDAYMVVGADHNNLEAQAESSYYARLSRFLGYLHHEPISDLLLEKARSASI